MRRRLPAVLSLAAAITGLGQSPAAADWMLGLGAFGVDADDDTVALADGEYRFAPRAWEVFPLVGIAATSDGGGYARAGAGRTFALAPAWSTTITFAVAGYEAGDGPDLGGALQFRSALEIGYELGPSITAGLGVAHLSNSGLDDHNPGVETLTLTLVYRPGVR